MFTIMSETTLPRASKLGVCGPTISCLKLPLFDPNNQVLPVLSENSRGQDGASQTGIIYKMGLLRLILIELL